MISVHRLNQNGNDVYRQFFLDKVNGRDLEAPTEILADFRFTESVNGGGEVEARAFANRYELGCYLVDVLRHCTLSDIRNDEGLWNWLTLFFFDQVYPGPRGAKELYKYLFSGNEPLKWHRHLVRTPWDLVHTHGDLAEFVLTSPINQHSDFVEQLITRQYIRANPTLLQVARSLFFIPGTNGDIGMVKKNALDKETKGKPIPAGTVRRFVTVTRQLEETRDFYAMAPKAVIDLLPVEFDAWH